MIDGETGTVFAAGNQGEFLAALKRLSAELPQLALMGEKARTFTLEKGPVAAETYNTILRTGGHAPRDASSSGESQGGQPGRPTPKSRSCSFKKLTRNPKCPRSSQARS
jgi:hypothetical protein